MKRGLVPAPAGLPFDAVAGIKVIRGDQAVSARRETVPFGELLPPPHLLPAIGDLPAELLDPDPAQRLDGGQLPQPRRRARPVHLLQQVVAVGAVPHHQRLPAGLALRQVQVIDPRAVDLLPGLIDRPGQPVRHRDRQRLQRRPQRLPGQLQPVQLTDRAQHVSGIGALPAAGLDQAEPGQALQQRVQRQARQIAGHQPGPELAQHAGVKALVIQLQAQRVLPRHPVPDRVSSLPASQVLRELQHAGHHQLPRRDPRPPPHPERGGKPRIGVHLAQLLADPHRQIPLRERRPRHSRSEPGNIRPRPRLHRHDHTILRPDEGKATARRSSASRTGL